MLTRLLVGFTALAVVTGLGLDSMLGNRFLADGPFPGTALNVLFAITSVPVTAWVLFSEHAKARAPNLWVRVLMFPIAAVSMFCVFHLSAAGHHVGLSRLLARQSAPVELEVLGNRRTETRRSVCHQSLSLTYRSRAEHLCADDLVPDGNPVMKGTIFADGVRSPFGFHVRSLRPQPR